MFSYHKRDNENMGEIVLETLLSSDIDCISNLDLSSNASWFWPSRFPEESSETEEEKTSNAELLAELIDKQTGLQHILLGTMNEDANGNQFSSSATQLILTRIAGHSSTCSKL